MSIQLSGSSSLQDVDDNSASSSSDDDQAWDDWVSDNQSKVPCRSLFDEKTFASVEEAMKYDNDEHNFDLEDTVSRLSLDFHGRIRLINFIRNMHPDTTRLLDLQKSDPIFSADEYLIPVLEDDPFLQFQPEWSDSEDEKNPSSRIRSLELQLQRATEDLSKYHSLITNKLDLTDGEVQEPSKRDDDSHYFDSYGENDIHAVMIQDTVRTSTYADFIASSPGLFTDAVVLDVGCGTGILSMFAARSGAKRVFAVDASDIAEKAAKIIKANGLEDVVTVIRGKVEEIDLNQKVDVIISEWMGYALLYESMLDSVLHARDRFLRPGGVMAPSQCHMVLGLCDASEVYKERIGFWDDVYGFNMSTMAKDLYNDSIVDVVGPETLLSEPYIVKDLILSEILPRQLHFTSSFSLISTASKRTKVNAFLLYFDTFFTTDGLPVPPNTKVKLVKPDEPELAEVWPVGGKAAPLRRASTNKGKRPAQITSFSTGPQSKPTHWKQTLFLLKEPLVVTDGSIVKGTFYCKKSDTNSRELDVEIHYSVRESAEDTSPESVSVQMFKVR